MPESEAPDANAGLADIGNGGEESTMRASAELIPWRARLDKTVARVRRERGSNYVQLSTVDPAGHPRCRTVVMRGWVGDAIKMITDARSEKVQHIQHSPSAEMVWWFPKSSEQYRLAGSL